MNSKDIVDRYIAAWNEGDDARRLQVIAASWSPAASYLDPMMSGEGHGGISAMIGGARTHFPGHRFLLASEPEEVADRLRFSWSLVSGDGDVVARGTDFARVDPSGKLVEVTGFLDQRPG